MNIVHIISSFTGGGAERFVVSLCNELVRNKALEIHVVSLFKIEEQMFLHEELDPTVKLHTLGKKKGFDLSVFLKLYKVLKTIQPDVVNTHLRALNYNYFNILVFKKTKYYHTIHNDALIECASKPIRSIRRLFFKKRVQAITISNAGSTSFQTVYGLDSDITIFNGREPLCKTSKFQATQHQLTSYKQNEQTKTFLHVANLLPLKNHLNLVKAFDAYLKTGANAVLLLIGDRRPNDDDIYLEMEPYLSNNIKYLGKKNNVADYLILSDAFLLPSILEGMPIVIIEALASKCTPIVTPVGGVADMITHNANGVIVKNPSITAIYNALTYYTELKKETIDVLNINAHNLFINTYTISKCAKNYLRLYTTK